MERQDAHIKKAADRYLNLQQADGTWLNHQSCLYALTFRTFLKVGYGAYPAMQRAWTYLETRLVEMGRLLLDFTRAQATWKVGSRGEPNPWLTVYAQRAKK